MINIAHVGSRRIAKVDEYNKKPGAHTDGGYTTVEVVGVEVNHRVYKTRNGNVKSSMSISYTVEVYVEQVMYKDAPVGERQERYTISHEDLN